MSGLNPSTFTTLRVRLPERLIRWLSEHHPTLAGAPSWSGTVTYYNGYTGDYVVEELVEVLLQYPQPGNIQLELWAYCQKGETHLMRDLLSIIARRYQALGHLCSPQMHRLLAGLVLHGFRVRLTAPSELLPVLWQILVDGFPDPVSECLRYHHDLPSELVLNTGHPVLIRDHYLATGRASARDYLRAHPELLDRDGCAAIREMAIVSRPRLAEYLEGLESGPQLAHGVEYLPEHTRWEMVARHREALLRCRDQWPAYLQERAHWVEDAPDSLPSPAPTYLEAILHCCPRLADHLLPTRGLSNGQCRRALQQVIIAGRWGIAREVLTGPAWERHLPRTGYAWSGCLECLYREHGAEAVREVVRECGISHTSVATWCSEWWRRQPEVVAEIWGQPFWRLGKGLAQYLIGAEHPGQRWIERAPGYYTRNAPDVPVEEAFPDGIPCLPKPPKMMRGYY